MAERIVRSNHEGCRRPLLSGLENNVFTIDATNEARAARAALPKSAKSDNLIVGVPSSGGREGPGLWEMVETSVGDGPAAACADGGTVSKTEDAGSSLALRTLRGLLILFLLGFHSVLAYLGSLGAPAHSFDEPPYEWRAFPVVDSHRWFGFDIFCAWQDVYLMSLLFFVSGLFVWPSLARKGRGRFLAERLLRLGIPFVFGVGVVTPLALYPAYRLTTTDDAGLIAYIRHYLALPFLPNGPMWFLWLLMAMTIAAVGLHRFAPAAIAFLGRLSSAAAGHPGRYFIGLATAAALAYVPMALAFTPFEWATSGVLGLQLSRPLLYSVYYFAGLGVGAYGLERGLLVAGGALARRWRFWLACALGSLLLWMALTALTMNYTPIVLKVSADISFALAGASGCFFMMAACLRFGAVRSRLIDSLSDNAFGMYLLHYPFLVWLQYALLGSALFAVAKATIVYGGTVLLAWASTVALRSIPFGSRLIGEPPRTPSRRETIAREADVRLDRSQTAR